MGNFITKKSDQIEDVDETTNVPTISEEFIEKYGEPNCITKNTDLFFATSYEEDCFLMHNSRNCFDTRAEWNNQKLVIYFKNKQIVRSFGEL